MATISEVRMATTDRPAGAEPGHVGTCLECGAQMVATVSVDSDEERLLQFECQDCSANGRMRYPLERGGLEDPIDREGVRDVAFAWIRWIDCPRCYGSGKVDPMCDLQRAAGKKVSCPRCHGTGNEPEIVEEED
jgi:hypothetical protein